jgi:hypothetical protein
MPSREECYDSRNSDGCLVVAGSSYLTDIRAVKVKDIFTWAMVACMFILAKCK